MEEKVNKNGIGLVGLTALIVSSSIGTGIFGITSSIAQSAAPGPAILSWLLVGFGFLMLVLSLNNLTEKRSDLRVVSSLTPGPAMALWANSFPAGPTG